jgi:hypothetical protein
LQRILSATVKIYNAVFRRLFRFGAALLESRRSRQGLEGTGSTVIDDPATSMALWFRASDAQGPQLGVFAAVLAPGTKDALQFLMTRAITHMKAFTAALESMGKPTFSIGIAPTAV